MKRSPWLICIFCFLICCGPKQDEVERIMEDGVEVVLNHREPYVISDEPSHLLLEKELSIDMESREIEDIGFEDIDYFDLDSEGNIYIVSTGPKDKLVFKFGIKGKYISSFGRMGQGPGEVQFVLYFGINNRDRIIISDHMQKKVIFFSDEGKLIEEKPYDPDFFTMFPLENKKYLFLRNIQDIENKRLSQSLRICNSEYEARKELDAYYLAGRSGAIQISSPIFEWRVSDGKIYIVNEQRGYEILVYDLNGTLKRKIRREYDPLDYPEDLKKKYIERYGTSRRIEFPENFPPIQSFFVDDEGRLFVMTYEKGENTGEYVFDIFNSDGVFIQRKSWNILNNWDMQAKAKKGHLYCVKEKESGYKELVVYKMVWN